MKNNYTLGLNIALVLAVVVLFYLHFASPKENVVAVSSTKMVPSGHFRIAYFDIDSIQNQFEYFKEIKNQLEAGTQENKKLLRHLKSTFAG